MFERWKSMEGGKRRSTQQYQDTFDRYAGSLSNRRIDLITREEVTTAHATVGEENGHYAANRVLAVLSIVFKWAGKHYQAADMTKGVDRFPESIRERFLQPEELVKFYAGVESEPDPAWKDFWLLLIATGARRGNVAGMAWREVDLIGKTWRIPAGRAKGKRAIPVPLSDEAVALLRRRKDSQTSDEWVFPSYSLSGHLTDPKAAWGRLLTRSGLDNFSGAERTGRRTPTPRRSRRWGKASLPCRSIESRYSKCTTGSSQRDSRPLAADKPVARFHENEKP